jgi:hypothetical protein
MEVGPIDVSWHSHPREIPSAAWELDGGRQACLFLPYLSAMQDSAPDFVKSWHYATAHPAATEREGGADSVLGLLVAIVIEASDPEMLGPTPLRLFVLSDPMGMCRPPILSAGRSEAERGRITRALLLSAIERARGEHADGVHAYWLGEGQEELRATLLELGFLSIPEDPCAHVPLLAREIGAHPGALRGSYRSVIKRKRQQLAGLGLSIRSAPSAQEPRPDPDALDTLYQKVAERKEEERWEIVESRFSSRFFELALTDPAFRLTLCASSDGALFGYLLGLQSGDTFISLAVGLDYDRIEGQGASGLAAAIFLGLHAGALDQAQTEGARWAVLGITALEGKARIGALCERNFGMGLGLSERAMRVLRGAQESPVPRDGPPACRPYPDAALVPINAEAARRGIRFVEPAAEPGT